MFYPYIMVEEAEKNKEKRRENIVNLALPLFLFYIVVGSNFLKDTFGCTIRHILETNLMAKHILGFLFVFFFMVLQRPTSADTELRKLFILSVGIYLWFFVTTKVEFAYLIVIIVLLIAAYVAGIAKTRYEKNNELEKSVEIDRMRKTLALIALYLSIGGFIVTIVVLKIVYRDMSIWKYLTTNTCVFD